MTDASALESAEDRLEEIVKIEIERESNLELVAIEVEEREDLLDHVRERPGLNAEFLIFERGADPTAFRELRVPNSVAEAA